MNKTFHNITRLQISLNPVNKLEETIEIAIHTPTRKQKNKKNKKKTKTLQKKKKENQNLKVTHFTKPPNINKLPIQLTEIKS